MGFLRAIFARFHHAFRVISQLIPAGSPMVNARGRLNWLNSSITDMGKDPGSAGLFDADIDMGRTPEITKITL